MTKYVKSDIVDRPHLAAGKAYEVLNSEGTHVAIRTDGAGIALVIPDNDEGYTCAHLDDKDTWKWCDKEGNEL